MATIATKITDKIGNTPLVELSEFDKKYDIPARLMAKLESFNPGGSVKDRVALSMVTDAEERGLLKPGATIIEPTSGNTGIGLAMVATCRGYHLILTMPDTMSVERRNLLAAYGAEIILTPGSEGMNGAIRRAEQLRDAIPGSVILGQFDNEANPRAHAQTTGPEIWRDTEGRVAYFVAGVGTGGTITGVGRYLKSRNPDVKIIAVEPKDSPVLSGGKPGPHTLQGIGAGFVPAVLDRSVIDEVVTVSGPDAVEAARRLASTEGILAGFSSGAALHAACEIARRPEAAGAEIVVLLPDGGERYLSTKLFHD